MNKVLVRIVLYICIFILIVGGVGGYGALNSRGDWLSVRNTIDSQYSITIPEYNPDKPTVAVVLGNPLTEIFDFMVPYEMFAMTEAYNVFAVAPDNTAVSLTGGLDIIPHYSFEQMDEIVGKSPDLIVVPYMPIVDKKKYQPVREWLQKHKDTEILSICSGSRNLADAGLLDGKNSTIHWRIVNSVEKKYPETNWIRDQRYVQDGNTTASAGLTSGIDAVLHVISRQLGEFAAEKVALELNYPTYHFVQNPQVEPYYIDHTEAIYYLNLAFQFNKTKMGVLLYEGMEESGLASIFDTYAPLGTTKIFTLSTSDLPIVTKHNLNILARHIMEEAPAIDRLLISGPNAQKLAVQHMKQWSDLGNEAEPEFIHDSQTNRFAFDATLEDLAKEEDTLTAKWAVKRLEYRAEHLTFEGSPLPLEAVITALLLGLVAIMLAHLIDRRFIKQKRSYKSGLL